MSVNTEFLRRCLDTLERTLDLVLRGPDLDKIDESRLAELAESLRVSTIPFLVEARD